MGFETTIAVKDLRVELTLPISGNVDVLKPTAGCDKITSVGAEALAFAFGTAFSPGGSDEGIELLTHHQFDHRPHSTLSQGAQMLVKFLLLG